jgi:hypothetical protein
MPISDAAIRSLGLGKDVYDDLTYCLGQWQEAGWKAAASVPDPQDENSSLDWAISFLGNLAWAVTVFFPAAFEVSAGVTYATASRATKIVSVVGATFAGGIVPELRKVFGRLDSPDGKRFLQRYFGSQVPDILKEYTGQVQDWVDKDLVNHLIAKYSLSKKPNPNDNNDAGFIAFVTSALGAEERRRYVWDDYVFPGGMTTYDNRTDDNGGRTLGGQEGLQDFFARRLDDMIRDFNRQWNLYTTGIGAQAMMRVEGTHGHVKYDDEIQRLMQTRPFNPVFQFQGLPPKLQQQQDDRRRILKLQMSMYGIYT